MAFPLETILRPGFVDRIRGVLYFVQLDVN
jgi:hypothetical protein